MCSGVKCVAQHYYVLINELCPKLSRVTLSLCYCGDPNRMQVKNWTVQKVKNSSHKYHWQRAATSIKMEWLHLLNSASSTSGSIITDSCCAAKHKSNPHKLIEDSTPNPKVSKDGKMSGGIWGKCEQKTSTTFLLGTVESSNQSMFSWNSSVSISIMWLVCFLWNVWCCCLCHDSLGKEIWNLNGKISGKIKIKSNKTIKHSFI